MSKDVLSKIRSNDVYKGLVRVLSDYRVEGYEVKDKRPHPCFIIRYCGVEREFEFPGTPRRRVNVKSYAAKLRRFLQDMQMESLEMEALQVVPSKIGQVHVPMNGTAVINDMFEPSYDDIAPREGYIGGELVQTVSARDLHTFLGLSRDFNQWMREQIQRVRLKEGRDFQSYEDVGLGPRARREYTLTVEAAKHIAMMSGADKGFDVRDYFIDCERKVKEQQQPSRALTTAEMFLQTAQAMVEIEQRQSEQDSRIAAIGNQVQSIQDAHYIHPECPRTAEPITKIKDRIGKKYGLSYDVITYVLRESPYAPRTISIRNKHENANGAVYQAFYIKNVTDIFERFIRECKHVVGDFYEHPYIRGRFKMVLR